MKDPLPACQRIIVQKAENVEEGENEQADEGDDKDARGSVKIKTFPLFSQHTHSRFQRVFNNWFTFHIYLPEISRDMTL